MFRRMELSGQVRGGRFVSGVAGEQFADEPVVEALRAVRDAAADETWVVISGADPVNLTGIITGQARIKAHPQNTLILQCGRCVAAKQSRQVEFFAEFEPETAAQMQRALLTGRRESASHIRPAWIDSQMKRDEGTFSTSDSQRAER